MSGLFCALLRGVVDNSGLVVKRKSVTRKEVVETGSQHAAINRRTELYALLRAEWRYCVTKYINVKNRAITDEKIKMYLNPCLPSARLY